MRYELTDLEWAAIKPFLPNKPRGVPRVNDRRVLNGIFWVLRSGAPWRDLPVSFGPRTTCYNRFVRWRRAGVWDRIMNALSADHDAAVQMIDTSIIRVHQHGACIARNKRQSMGRSRGGLTSKIHALVDSSGLPVRLALTTGEAHDNRLAVKLLSRLKSGTMLLADRGYDADWIRDLVRQRGAWANIPPKRNRTEALSFSPYLYRGRNLVERFFSFEKAGATAFALMTFITLPTDRTNGISPTGVEGGVILLFAVNLSDKFTLGLNGGLHIVRNESAPGTHAEWISSASLSYEWNDKLSTYYEVAGRFATKDPRGDIGILATGFTYKLAKNLQLDGGVNFGVTKAADRLNPFVGFSARY